MAEMNATQTKYCLKNLPIYQSILISGDHGRGKSEIVAQAAKAMEGSLVDIRLSQNDVGDIKGMPFHVNGRTFFAPPSWFPIKDEDAKMLQKLLGLTEAISSGQYGPRGILFLDELNRAPREVQQAGFELVLDRRLNMLAIPDGWRVVAAINGNSEIYTVNDMEPALLSRFFLIDFNPTIDEWLEWAVAHEKDGVHTSVTQFIRKKSDFLDPTPELLKEAVTKGVIKIQDRRSWTRFAKAISELEHKFEQGLIPTSPLDKNPENIAMLILLAAGFVGHLASLAFTQFIETDYQSLDADIILNKWTPDIKARIQTIVDEGRIPELGAYNEDIIAFLKKNVSDKLSDKQSENLANYLEMLPKEPVSSFWMSLNTDCGKVAEQWYRSNKRHTKIIMDAVIKPKQ